MTTRLALATLLLIGASGCASAKPPAIAAPDPDLTCAFKHAVASVDSLKKLPPDVQRALQAKAGAMADRGEFFNATDVVQKPAPFNRFIRGGTLSEYAFAWYEHGGIAYWKQIVLFAREPFTRVRAEVRAAGGADLCAQTDRLLDGLGMTH